MPDQWMDCVECGRSFVWSAGEQRYYAERHLHPPKRCRACRARRRRGPDPRPSPARRPRTPRNPAHTGAASLVGRYVGTALGLTVIVTLALWLAGWDGLLAWGVAITGVTFLVYAYDKAIAGSSATRVPETALLVLALAGGTLGAWAGMYFLRHKTAKESFQFKFLLLLLLQVTLVIGYVYLFGLAG